MSRRSQRKQALYYLTPEKRKGKNLNAPAPYRSWLEADTAYQLKKQKIKFEYETQKIVYVVPAQTHVYTPDFVLPNGIIVETKGIWSADDRKKMGLIKEQHPDIDVRMVFGLDNKISKNSKTRYSTWCEKRGIKYAIGSIPEEWLHE
jgi:hypothetical protein